MRDDALRAYGRDVIRRGSRSFAMASALFPPNVRDRAHLLYAWCRYCDDEVDGQRLGHATARAGPDGAMERLARIRARTAAALQGDETLAEPAFLALRAVVARSAIPPVHAVELLEGFQWDAERRRYATLDDLLAYCYHVAGCVGVMMAHAMEVTDQDTLDRAADLGIAFQLTNIARDVRDDARAGRLYLPLDWLAEAGVTPAAVGTAAAAPRVAAVVARLLDMAEAYYASAAAGLRGLPFRSAWAVAAALSIYREIGRAVRRRGADAWNRRVVIPGYRKAAAVVAALFRMLVARARRGHRSPAREGLWTRGAPDRAPG